MKEIPLTNGGVALVDDEDATLVDSYRWRRDQQGYARTNVPDERTKSGQRSTLMHHLVLVCPPGMVRDHLNGDQLDNRKSNLRLATYAQNRANSRGWSKRQLPKGVKASRRKYIAVLGVPGYGYLGTFDTPERAALAYDEAARIAYGAFACLNYPGGGERGAR